MTYDLFLGDRTYSSWSFRAWLLFEKFNIPVTTHYVDFNASEGVAAQLADLAPARTVPTLRLGDGTVIPESLAIAEELASREPGVGIWPTDPAARARARALAAEMCAGFSALRQECPMHLNAAYRDVPISDAVLADLRRLEEIWSHARSTTSPPGPWLAGPYSAADAFYAPVAARIATYGLKVNAAAQRYVDAHLADTAFRRWRAMGIAKGVVLSWYARDYPTTTWPGPTPLTAEALESGTPENERCPYSGKTITHLARIEGRTFGFCNAFCRDKTIADPAAWPAFMEIYQT